MQEFSEGESTIVVDDHLAPIYFAAWIGVPTETIARSYCNWSTKVIQRAVRTQRACVVIIDSASAARPSAAVRAAIAEMTERTPRVAVYVSAPHALVRGAITAMQWISRKPWPMTMVSSVEDGAKKALVFLRNAGVTPPEGFDPSRCPRLTR
jgi:hypothetical protein